MVTGRLLHDPALAAEPGWLRIREGVIVERGFGEPPTAGGEHLIGSRSAVITPAFVDAHMHLPQIDSIGCDGMPLLGWLDRVVFPAEAWWGRGQHLSMTRIAAMRMARAGTCGFAGYLTSDAETGAAALRWLADRTPMRFVAGRVAMDRNAPDELTREDRQRVRMNPTPAPVLPQLERSPRQVGRDGWIVKRAVSANPRFAVACSDELLAEIGWYVREHPGVFVQTHLAESPDELAAIRELFPNDAHYTGVYQRAGLLGQRTLLAHCCHLSDDEWGLLAESESVVVHCPGANVFLEAGLFDLDAARAHGVRLALGSDIAAGPDVAMPRVARAMIETAKVRKLTGVAPDAHVPSPAEAWRLITSGNAHALGWPDVGELDEGRAASLLVLHVPDAWLDEHLVGRLLYNWSDHLVAHRLFDGHRVDPDRIDARC
jgi:guanine deaminase